MKDNQFNYKNLEKYIICNKKTIIYLLISLEKPNYSGENLFLLLKDLKNKIKQSIPIAETLKIEVGDTVNRHNWYYRYCEEYMLKNNLTEEKQIPQKIQNEFNKKAYNKGREQGKEWFKNNLTAINQLIPDKHKLNKDYKITNNISILYKGDKNNPKVELVCYEHWLNHPKYKVIEKTLKEVCQTGNEIERSLLHESNYFYTRYSKRKLNITNKRLFLKKSYDYLFDETIAYILRNHTSKNILEFYFGGGDLKISLTFKGHKIQKNLTIKKLMEKGNPLEGADQRKFISISLEEK